MKGNGKEVASTIVGEMFQIGINHSTPLTENLYNIDEGRFNYQASPYPLCQYTQTSKPKTHTKVSHGGVLISLSYPLIQ